MVTAGDNLIAAIEAKSMSGSFGNNLNNRVEEAVGGAQDLWRSYEAGLLGSVRPWLGWVYVIESRDGARGSSLPVRGGAKPLFPTDPVFEETSYIDRARIAAQRFVAERLYDAACLVTTEQGGGILPETDWTTSTRHLSAAIAGRVAYASAMLRDAA